MNLSLRVTLEKYEKRVVLFISTYFFIFNLNLLVKLIIGNFAGWNYISMGALGVLLILMLIYMPSNIKQLLVACEILIGIMFLFSFLFGNYNSSFGSILFNVCAVYIPLAVGLYSLNDYSALLKRMYILAWPSQVILIYTLMNVVTLNNYSMSGGYALLLQLLIVTDHFVSSRKWYDLAASFVDLIIIFSFASRGPLICFGVFILLKVLFSYDVSKNKKTIKIFLTALILIAIVAFYNEIINLLITLMSYLGFRSRTLSMLLNNNISDLSGRRGITNYFIQLIHEKPILGWGLGGGWKNGQDYPHNLFVEMVVSYGYILGIVFSVAIVIIFIKAILKKDSFQRRLAHILFAYCIALLISSSYLLTPHFFLCLAVGMKMSRESTNANNEEVIVHS